MSVAHDAGVVGKAAVPPLVHVVVATLALFAVGGFGLTRLLLPAGLRRHELLWVCPVGACAVALTMTVLGFAAVPFDVNLGLTLAGGVALAVVALRREPFAPRDYVRGALWPLYVAALVAAIALVPLFRAGFVTVEGQGQDAHLAVGTAMFLQHHHPLSTHPEEPVDKVPLVWRSKQPIYYTLGAAARLSGKEVFETISAVEAVLLALAALGFFLIARELAGAPRWAAVGAAALVGLDRMVLHTVMHPYFNQSWAFMAMPYALVLGWWAVRERTRGGPALLALLVAVLTFAYPLALPIPLLALVILLWPERRALWRSLRGAYHGRRSLWWMIPLGILLLRPITGVWEKMVSAFNLLAANESLANWGGDLTDWYPEPWFLGAATWPALILVGPLLVWLGWRALAAMEPRLRASLLAILAFGAVFAVYFRIRDFGWYFHFKTLAFVAPVALALAAAGAARVRRGLGIAALAVLVMAGLASARREVNTTFDELPKWILALRDVDAALPPGQSIRLDVDPQAQNWVAFWLHGQPLCSRRPLLHTSYPHVPTSRKADYILTPIAARRPADAAGEVMTAGGFRLYRQRPSVPGRENCSQRMVQTVTDIPVS